MSGRATDDTEAQGQLDAEFSDLYRLICATCTATRTTASATITTRRTSRADLSPGLRHFERAQRESDGRPLRPWLIRIAHNLAATSTATVAQARLADRRQHNAHGDAHHEQLVEGRDELSRVLDGVGKLPDDRRERSSCGSRWHGQPRDSAGIGTHRRSHQGTHPSRHQQLEEIVGDRGDGDGPSRKTAAKAEGAASDE